ncbi:MAG: UDP-N-acetylmuramoyl-L-alanine--D-glutamate ligase [Treponemataceae bacterium]|nr:MAG: UDP-N-acetylmuramoyl-L-alanine--D-glutamate ligase [Treponemataceae bacterium]
MPNDAKKHPKIYPKESALKTLADIAGKKITVMGLGLNGGGEASARFFLRHGAFVTVTDTKTQDELMQSVLSLQNDTRIDASRLRFVLGRHDKEDFLNADIVIKNPIVKYEANEFLHCAKAVETDLSVFLRFTKARIIAVTGSKGKSTTASAIHYGLTQSGFKSFLGGNITVSPLTFLEETDSESIVVLELSSWQLRDLRGRGALKPAIAVLTKIVSDHQNWYGNMDDYVADKKLIYADQRKDDWTIIADDSGYAAGFAAETPAQAFCIHALTATQTSEYIGELAVRGAHNRTNVLTAAVCVNLLGVAKEQCRGIFASWHGIPHRLEYFFTAKTRRGVHVDFYNDSASTVPDSTIASIDAFGSMNASCSGLRLIAGGTDKELDFTELAAKLRKNPPFALYLLAGSGTDKLIDKLCDTRIDKLNDKLNDTHKTEKIEKKIYKGPYTGLIFLLNDIKLDLEQSDESYPVVFSPGATSFGMFKNEFDRGNTFKEGVLSIYGND